MSRVIPQHVIGPPGSTLAEMRTLLQPSINLLISLQGDARVERVLRAVSEGHTHVTLPGLWPGVLVFAVANLISNVRSGEYHLLRCIDCAHWMLVKRATDCSAPLSKSTTRGTAVKIAPMYPQGKYARSQKRAAKTLVINLFVSLTP